MLGGFLIILATALWAIDTLIRYPLMFGGVTAETIIFVEHAILAMFMMPVFYKIRFKFWEARVSSLFYFLVVGVLGSAVASLAFTKAFGMINPSFVILLQKLQPLVVVLLARLLLKEQIQRGFIIWGSVALFGSFLISFEDIFPNIMNYDFSVKDFSSKAFRGYIYTLIAVVSWGSATVFGKKLTVVGYQPKEIMAGRFMIAFLFMIPIIIWTGFGQLSSLSDISVGSRIFLMAIISGLLAMYLYYKGLQRVSARVGALLEMFFPIFAVLANWTFLGHYIGPVQIVGGCLLLLSSIVIQLKHY